MKTAKENEKKTLQKTDFGKICRCCLGMSPTTSIFELKFEETEFFEILQCLFYSEVKVDDELPRNVCQQCVDKVLQCYSFKRSYDMAEAILLGILENSKEEQQNENDETHEIKLEIASEENCLKIDGDIKIQFYETIVEGTSKEKGDVNNSITIEDCEIQEHKEKPMLHTEIKLEDTSDENVNNPVNLGDLPRENQIVDIPKPKATDKKKKKKKSVKNANNKDGEFSKMMTCSCLQVFATKVEYYAHRRKEQHLHRKLYPCEICHKFFPSNGLLIHMRSHTKEKPFKCEFCSKNFSSYFNLCRHKRTHTGEKPYKCEHCGKAFTQSTTLVYHKRIHTKEKPYLCTICGVSFGNPVPFYIHNRKHKQEGANPVQTPSQGFEDFFCSICEKEFPSKHSLSIHMGRHKHNKGTYLCTYCGKSFVHRSSFDQHTYVHTAERRFSCKFCQKKFKQAGSLKVHTYIHTGERPFICEICQRGFSQGQQLKSHYKTHTGEKPYKCNICEKAFTHKTTYDVHVRTHTGERPFVCDGCQKGFYHSSSMKKHRKQYCKGVPAKADV